MVEHERTISVPRMMKWMFRHIKEVYEDAAAVHAVRRLRQTAIWAFAPLNNEARKRGGRPSESVEKPQGGVRHQ